jgi:hypothetical protein
MNGGNNYIIWCTGKQVLLRQFGYLPRTFAATDETLQVVQMFSGDGGKISNTGENDLDAGAGDDAVDQMIMPIACGSLIAISSRKNDCHHCDDHR